MQWIASIYLLIISALLHILGTIADHFGRRRIYNPGFFVISLFTLVCVFSINLPMLIAMRVLQAVGGAMVMANGMAIGSIAGPPLGGVAIGLWGWRSVFYLTFVVSMAGFLWIGDQRHRPGSLGECDAADPISWAACQRISLERPMGSLS